MAKPPITRPPPPAPENLPENEEEPTLLMEEQEPEPEPKSHNKSFGLLLAIIAVPVLVMVAILLWPKPAASETLTSLREPESQSRAAPGTVPSPDGPPRIGASTMVRVPVNTPLSGVLREREAQEAIEQTYRQRGAEGVLTMLEPRLKSPDFLPLERIAYVRLAQESNRLTSARDALQPLLAASSPSSEALALAFRQELLENNWKEALTYCQRLLQVNPLAVRTRGTPIFPTFLALLEKLREQRQFSTILELIPDAVATSHDRLLVFRLEALYDLHQYGAASTLLQRSENLIVPSMRLRLKALLAWAMNDSAAESIWLEALALAEREDSLSELFALAQTAQLRQQPAYAQRAFQAMLKTPERRQRLRPEVWLAALRNAAEMHEAQAMLAIAAGMVERFPEEPSWKHNHTYLQLLLLADVSGALAPARANFEAAPSNVNFRTVYALAKWRNGDLAGAVDVAKGIVPTDLSLSPGNRAVLAGLFKAAGQADLAAAYWGETKPEMLLPWEAEIAAPPPTST